MTSPQHIAVIYASFAVLATGVNLTTQWIVLKIVAPLNFDAWIELIVALSWGTCTGLIIKYCLDKRYIFHDVSTGAKVHARKFPLYVATGGVTTAIFWSAEIIGALIDPEGGGLYIGGILGLMAGYVIKYRLDKALVFEVPLPEERAT